MTKPLIHIDRLVKTYCLADVRTQILKSISLHVKQGDLLAIVGASGSGKSTLMNIIGLLDKADSGDYYLNQKRVADLNDDERAILRNQHIGFIFQQFNLLPRFNAAQNVALPLEYRRMETAEIQTRVQKALSLVRMEKFAHHKPMQLSGGQQQRIAIARALVTNPEVLLADEPTGALDSQTGAEVLAIFHQLHAEGRTIIMVTHDKHVAEQCSRQIVIADGEIIAEHRV